MLHSLYCFEHSKSIVRNVKAVPYDLCIMTNYLCLILCIFSCPNIFRICFFNVLFNICIYSVWILLEFCICRHEKQTGCSIYNIIYVSFVPTICSMNIIIVHNFREKESTIWNWRNILNRNAFEKAGSRPPDIWFKLIRNIHQPSVEVPVYSLPKICSDPKNWSLTKSSCKRQIASV